MNDRFGSTARDFAAGIVTREGGTPEDVRELSYGSGPGPYRVRSPR